MKLQKKISSHWLLLVLFLMMATIAIMIQRGDLAIYDLKSTLSSIQKSSESAEQALENLETLDSLKRQDLLLFTENLTDVATSKKELFESGVMLHDEKRLLEKQWDIMATSILIDEEKMRIRVLKSQEPVESFVLSSGPVLLGIVDSTTPIKIPDITRIVSKERFAHPERGKAETVDGVLKWTPPQVGTSARANALGEYVIFTNSPLILHGPPRNEVDHQNHRHLCLYLSQDMARSLYQKTYIGTRITLIMSKPISEENSDHGLSE